MKTLQLNTPLGPMIAVADDFALYRLDFEDNPDLPKAMERLEKQAEGLITAGETQVLSLVKKELQAYFEGTLIAFTLPLAPDGTVFQKRTWLALTKIPYSTTQSYGDIAAALNQPTAFRAVANANGKNPISIAIPCHRIIKSSGDLCGYRSGIARKKWLLDHERRHNITL
jgi:AraC family transcriptional regulator of adaptative response/methylated-DNA-[protein]-cysteine methyltransferase